jgi:glycosyltransferase involved in cell wall biosynthesis
MTQSSNSRVFALDARTANNHFPGIGRYVSNLAQAMVSELAEDEQLLLLHDPTQPSRWQLPPSSERVIVLEAAVSPFSFWQQWRIPRLLRRHKATIYHSPYYLMPYWTRKPTVLTIYDLIPQQFPEMVSTEARRVFQRAMRQAIRKTRRIITISEATRNDLLAAYPISPDRVTAVPLAASLHFHPQPEAKIEQIREKYKLPEKYLLYVGINKPHKNLGRLLEAWRQIVSQSPEAPTLAIAGEWDDRYPEPKQHAEQLALGDRVKFLGPFEETDLPSLYSGATAFVFPSLYEGFGLPVIEAMACGTAVLCSHTASLPEVGGEAALYFDPTDSDNIASTIASTLADERILTQLQQRGLKQAAQFSWRKTAVATLAVYRQIDQT